MTTTRKQWFFIEDESYPTIGYFMIENSPIMYDINVCHSIGDIFRMERSNLGPMNGCKSCLKKGCIRGVFVAACNNCAMSLFAQKDHYFYEKYKAWHSAKTNMDTTDVGYKHYKNRTLRIYNNKDKHNACKIAVHTRFEDSPYYVVC
jgi:hypothetical protein